MKVNVFLLILGHALLELAELLQRIRPSIVNVYIKPFINYTWPHDNRGISLIWWVKYCTDSFLYIIVFFVMARVAAVYSFRLFIICGIWFLYHLFDGFMLWYNYRTSHWLYWVIVAGAALSIGSLFLPEKRAGKVVSLK